MKHIVFVLPNLNVGGAEKVAINYIRQLDPSYYLITLVVFDETSGLQELIPSHVKLKNLGSGSSFKSIYPLMKVLRSIKPDVVYTTHSRVAVVMMIIRPFLYPFLYLARMQSTPSLERQFGKYGLLTQILNTLGYRCADIVIAQTEQMKSEAINILGVKEENTRVMLNPLDTSSIDSIIQKSRSPFNERSISAVASGRLVYAKAFDVLIRSLPLVLDAYPSFRLYILGEDRGELNNLTTLVSDLGLDEVVVLEGFVADPVSYYLHCDLFILSSRWEGFPNALLENYYLNTPIVATRCVPIVETLVKEGINGALCNVEDEDSLASSIVKCIELKRANISNDSHIGSKLEVLFE